MSGDAAGIRRRADLRAKTTPGKERRPKMPGPNSVGANEKWLIVIEVQGQLDRTPTSDFNRAIHDAVKAAQRAQTRAKITFNSTGPAIQ